MAVPSVTIAVKAGRMSIGNHVCEWLRFQIMCPCHGCSETQVSCTNLLPGDVNLLQIAGVEVVREIPTAVLDIAVTLLAKRTEVLNAHPGVQILFIVPQTRPFVSPEVIRTILMAGSAIRYAFNALNSISSIMGVIKSEASILFTGFGNLPYDAVNAVTIGHLNSPLLFRACSALIARVE